LKRLINEDKSAARFPHQMATWVTDMFSNFYFIKKSQNCNYSTTEEAREKISTDFKSVDLYLKIEKDFCLMNLNTIKLH
jgi:hypothetical protein